MKDKNIKIILGGKYDYQFEKNRISSFGFYLCFPSIEKKFGFKIPKVLKKEIIKNLNNPPIFVQQNKDKTRKTNEKKCILF